MEKDKFYLYIKKTKNEAVLNLNEDSTVSYIKVGGKSGRPTIFNAFPSNY